MKKKKILLVGGGSGGHVTPVAAVIRELKKQAPQSEFRMWCDYGFAAQARGIMSHVDSRIPVQAIVAGKLRRYHHFTFLQHFTVPWVFWPNVRDFFLVIIGVFQSLVLLVIWRPSVIFSKGGFVCLPVGWAAWLLRIPLVIHDSDAHPGLTNRLLAPVATAIATGAPLEYYPYPKAKSRYIGTPVGEEFAPFSTTRQKAAKVQLGFDPLRPLVVVTGGGLGAGRINDAVVLHLQALLKKANLVLIAGADHYDELRALTPQDDMRFQLYGFVTHDMASFLGAADVVVARAGATTLLELAALAKPVILVPNAKLTGGHQLKNAKVYTDKQAVVLLDEDTFDEPGSTSLVDSITKVLGSEKIKTELSKNIYALARPNAAKQMAEMVLKAGKK